MHVFKVSFLGKLGTNLQRVENPRHFQLQKSTRVDVGTVGVQAANPLHQTASTAMGLGSSPAARLRLRSACWASETGSQYSIGLVVVR